MGRKTWWREQLRTEEEMLGFPAPSVLFPQSPSVAASMGHSQGDSSQPLRGTLSTCYHIPSTERHVVEFD